MKRREEWLKDVMSEGREDIVRMTGDNRFAEQVQSAVDAGANEWDVHVDLHRLSWLIIENTHYATNYVTHLENPDALMRPVGQADIERMEKFSENDPELRADNLRELRELAGKYPDVARQMVDFENYSRYEMERDEQEAQFEQAVAIEPMHRGELEDMIPKLALAYDKTAPEAYKSMYRMCDLVERWPDFTCELGAALKDNNGSLEALREQAASIDELSELYDLAGKYPEFMDSATRYAVDVINNSDREASDGEAFDDSDTELDEDAAMRQTEAEENAYRVRDEAYENALYWNPEDAPRLMRAYAEPGDSQVFKSASEMQLMRDIAEDLSFGEGSALGTRHDVQDVLSAASRPSRQMPEWLSSESDGPVSDVRSPEYLLKMQVLWDYSCEHQEYAKTLRSYVINEANAIFEAENPTAWMDEMDEMLAREAAEKAAESSYDVDEQAKEDAWFNSWFGDDDDRRKELVDSIPGRLAGLDGDLNQHYDNMCKLFSLADTYPEYLVNLAPQLDREGGTFDEGYGPASQAEIDFDESGVIGRINELRELAIQYPEFAKAVAAYEAVCLEEPEPERVTGPDDLFGDDFVFNFDPSDLPSPPELPFGSSDDYDAMMDGFVSDATGVSQPKFEFEPGSEPEPVWKDVTAEYETANFLHDVAEDMERLNEEHRVEKWGPPIPEGTDFEHESGAQSAGLDLSQGADMQKQGADIARQDSGSVPAKPKHKPAQHYVGDMELSGGDD